MSEVWPHLGQPRGKLLRAGVSGDFLLASVETIRENSQKRFALRQDFNVGLDC